MNASVAPARPLAVPRPITFMLYLSVIGAIVGTRLAVKKYRLLPTVLMASMAVQIGAVVGVPLVVLVLRWRAPKTPPERRHFSRDPISFAWLPNPVTCGAYVALGLLVWFVKGMLAEPSIWQLSAALQALSYAPLLLKVLTARNVSTISAKKLALDAVYLVCRLSAAQMLGLKLPRRAGQTSVMVADALALTFVMILLASVLGWRRGSYQASADSLSLRMPLLVIFGLAALLRVTLSKRFFPDFLWTLGLYMDVFAMLPQLWMVAQNGGVADEAVSHHVAGAFVSRLFGLTFWWLIRGTWHQGTRLAGWLILLACTSQILLHSHFMAYYLKAFVTRGPFGCAPLVCAEI